MDWYIDIEGRHHAPGTPYRGSQQPGDPVATSAPPDPSRRWVGGSWVVPTTATSWTSLLDWAALNADPLELWALQKSMFGTFLDKAATAGNWQGAAGYYAELKADLSTTPSKSGYDYSPATATTLSAIAAQFAGFGVPLTP